MTATGNQLQSMGAADTAPAAPAAADRTGAQLATAFPPRPLVSSWPATEASRSVVLSRVLAAPFGLDNPNSQQTRRLGVLAVLNWLRTQPGDSWQQRWRASGAEDQPDWRGLVGTDRAKPLPHLGPGLLVLVSIYRKIDTGSRTQAVLWGVTHGFTPDHHRIQHWKHSA